MGSHRERPRGITPESAKGSRSPRPGLLRRLMPFRLVRADVEAEEDDSYDGMPRWRLLVAFDIVGFGRRSEYLQGHVRNSMYQILKSSAAGSDIEWPPAVWLKDRGDGVVLVLDFDLAHRVMESFVEHVYADLRRHNAVSSDIAKISLRMAVHAGFVVRDDHGLTGEAFVHLTRLLDGPAFKESLAAHGSALGVLASEHIYDAVVRPGRGLIDPEAFSKLAIVNKETVAEAWLRLLAPHALTTGG
jgi:hypothetical protein